MDGGRFDDVTKVLAQQLSSRRGVVGGALGAALAILGHRARETGAAKCRGNLCRGGFRPCGGGDCACYRKASGGNLCAAPFGACRQCDSDRDCEERFGLRGFRCVRNGPRCCGKRGQGAGRKRTVCAAPCGSDLEDLAGLDVAGGEGWWGV